MHRANGKIGMSLNHSKDILWHHRRLSQSSQCLAVSMFTNLVVMSVNVNCAIDAQQNVAGDQTSLQFTFATNRLRTVSVVARVAVSTALGCAMLLKQVSGWSQVYHEQTVAILQFVLWYKTKHCSPDQFYNKVIHFAYINNWHFHQNKTN